MDAVIRFCFGIDSEDIFKEPTINECYKTGKYEKPDMLKNYAKVYGQAQYCWDHLELATAKKVVNGL